jgi:hypothetical protein
MLRAQLGEAGRGEDAVEGQRALDSRERIRAKLVASTNEYSRSSWRRSQRSASASSFSETKAMFSRERSSRSRKATAVRWSRRRPTDGGRHEAASVVSLGRDWR